MMTASSQITEVLSKWASVFMHRSMRDVSQFMRASGLSMTQVSTLFRLYYTGTCGVSDIGDHLGVSNAAASQLVERLVQQGLLARSEDPSDRRARRIDLTADGRRLVSEAIAGRRLWMQNLTTEFTPEERETIVAALSLLTEAARRSEQPSASSDAPTTTLEER